MKKLRLDETLLKKHLADSKTRAQAIIMTGRVKVNGQLSDKAGSLVSDEDEIVVLQGAKYVSRGGEKLESVADKLGLDFKNKVVLDVGSSTGGFTDLALQNGAKKVYAVDVGTGQLDWRLRNNTKVVVMEKTDIRNVTSLPDAIDLVVIDVSFISLKLVLPAVKNLTNNSTFVVAMAKPHFEADYITASKNKGVIKNKTIRRDILKRVEEFMRPNYKILAKADSAVLGRKGNQERFYLLKPLP